MSKKISVGVFTFLLVLSIPMRATAAAILYVDPSITLTSIGDTFSVNITVSDVSDLAGWEFKLYYLSLNLNGTNIVEGSFLKQNGSTYFAIVNFADDHNSTHGLAWVTCALLGGSQGVNGDGTLATLTFKTKQLGNSSLRLADTFLSDSEPIPHTTLSGEVYILPHDVAITYLALSKTVVGQGLTAKIYANVLNRGNFTETFNVTAYANTTVIQTRTVTLTSGTSLNVTFTWSTAGWAYGNYTTKAEADTVPGETNTSDNILIDGFVYVGIPGDVDANDFVDVKDILAIALAYGSYPGEPRYKPNLDVNGDEFIDIKDILIAALNYGQHYP